METITEKTYPYLRDLQWNGRLYDSPVLQKTLRRINRKSNQAGLITDYMIGIDAADNGRKDSTDVIKDLHEKWPVLAPLWRSNIDYLSKTFLEAVMSSAEAFGKAGSTVTDYLKNKTFSGTIIIPLYDNIVSYCLSFDDKGMIVHKKLLEIDKYGSVVMYINDSLKYVSNSFHFIDMKNGKIIVFECDDDKNRTAVEYITDFARNYILFCKFAEIKTKYIPKAGSREARKPNESMVSTCNLPIRRMYADYYTNIIRTDGFGVKGHLRLQACGPSHSEHKLIYIQAYEKKGYSRKARLLEK